MFRPKDGLSTIRLFRDESLSAAAGTAPSAGGTAAGWLAAGE
jgi:hypothetical protein